MLWRLGPSNLESLRNVSYGTGQGSVHVPLNFVRERVEPHTREPWG